MLCFLFFRFCFFFLFFMTGARQTAPKIIVESEEGEERGYGATYTASLQCITDSYCKKKKEKEK